MIKVFLSSLVDRINFGQYHKEVSDRSFQEVNEKAQQGGYTPPRADDATCAICRKRKTLLILIDRPTRDLGIWRTLSEFEEQFHHLFLCATCFETSWLRRWPGSDLPCVLLTPVHFEMDIPELQNLELMPNETAQFPALE